MSDNSERMKVYLEREGIDAEFLTFAQSVHTVEEAVSVSGYAVEWFTKSIVMLTADQQPIIAVVPADRRASTERERKALGLAERPTIATAAETEAYLGQQVGGNSPLNCPNATILIDPLVLAREWTLTGGGDHQHLVKISVAELKRVVVYREVRVRK
jgi:prolyl-tRNA editing enzyme YbaK/EbsC (Cys-tRNA(Pro) deacylase)